MKHDFYVHTPHLQAVEPEGMEGPPAVGLMHLLPMQSFPKLPGSIYDLKYKAIVVEVTKEVRTPLVKVYMFFLTSSRVFTGFVFSYKT